MHKNGREPGVWFFSLDAANLPAVLAARAGFALPYYDAKSRVGAMGGEPYYHFDRRRAAPVKTPLPARFDGAARIGDLLGVTEPGTLEFFLIERYILYADWRARRMGLKVAQVHHRPYPLQRAEVIDPVYDTLFRTAGLPVPEGPPLVHFSPGVDVEVFPIRNPAG